MLLHVPQLNQGKGEEDVEASSGSQAASGRQGRAARAGCCVSPGDELTRASVSQTWVLCTCMSLVVVAFVGAAAVTSWLVAADLDLAGSAAPVFSTDLAGGFRDVTAVSSQQLRTVHAALRWGREQEGLRRAAAGRAETCSLVDWWTGDVVCGIGNRTARTGRHDRWRLQLLLRAADGSDLFSPLHLDKLRSLVAAIESLPDVGTVCRADPQSTSGCEKIRSPLDVFYPTTVVSSYNFTQGGSALSYFVTPAAALALPRSPSDGVSITRTPVQTLVFDGGGLATASLPECILDTASYDGTQSPCSPAEGLGLPAWAPPRCLPCTDQWCNCAALAAGSARGTQQRVHGAALMLAATDLFRADLAASFGEAGSTSSSSLRLELALGVPLEGFENVADRREEQEEILARWVTESLEPVVSLQEAILGAAPEPIELVVSIPRAAALWTTRFRGVLVHDFTLGLLAAAMPLLLAARHTGYSGCLVFTIVAIELAAVGFAWLVSRYLIGVALYATSSSVLVLLLPLQFHSVTCLLDEWRNSILHDKLTANRGAAPKFATSIPPRPADERNIADRLRFMHGRGTAAILTVTSSATAAFLAVGVSSPLPAVASCGIFAALVLLVFSSLLVALFPCAMLLYHRTAEGRDGCCCCLTPIHTPQTPEPPLEGDKNRPVMPISPGTAPPTSARSSVPETEPLRLDRGPSPPPPPGTAQGARAGSISGGAKVRGEWRRREAGQVVGTEEPDIPTKQRCQCYELRAARWANHKKVKWASAPVTLACAAACAWWAALRLEAQHGVIPLLPDWHTTQQVAERLQNLGTDKRMDTVSILVVWGIGFDADQGTWAGQAPAPAFPLLGTPDVWSADFLVDRAGKAPSAAGTSPSWTSIAGVDLSTAESQRFIQDACAQLASRPDVLSVTCPLADFAAAQVDRGAAFPTTVLSEELQTWLATSWQNYAGTQTVEWTEHARSPRSSRWPFDLLGIDKDTGALRYIGARLQTTLSTKADSTQLESAMASWQEWADTLNTGGTAANAGSVVVVAEGGEFADADTAKHTTDTVLFTVAAAIIAAGIMLVLVGCNVLVVLVLILSIAATVSMALAATHWGGWMLGHSESLWVSLLAGLLIGRPAHIAYSFTQASLPDRPDRVLQSITGTGATCITSELICAGQGLLLWFAWAVPISRLGLLLLLGMVANAVTTHLVLLPALALLGPHGEFLLWHKAYVPLSVRPLFRTLCKIGFCQCSCKRKKGGQRRKDGGEMYLY
eukprot:COSAG02_NODE_1015_length_15191_cov_6.937450_2_plen_1252_part_00